METNFKVQFAVISRVIYAYLYFLVMYICISYTSKNEQGKLKTYVIIQKKNLDVSLEELSLLFIHNISGR